MSGAGRAVLAGSWLGLGLLLIVAAHARVPSVKDVVRRVERHYNRARTLEADFVQRYTLGASTLIESGHVYFEKPGRMRWDYESPEEKQFLTDGEYAYFYVAREQQVRRQPVKQAADWQAVFSLLLGRMKLGRVFDAIQLVRLHRPGASTRWQLRGRAKSEKLAFREVWLDLNENYQLLRIEIRQRDGSLMEFHFRGWRENYPLPADLFELRVPPGTAWLEEAPR